jgi:hypothetical protein
VEQFASWVYLNRSGVSLTRTNGDREGTDGKPIHHLKEEPPYHIDPDYALQHFKDMELGRGMCYQLFRHMHQYMEIPTHQVFTDEGRRDIMEFLSEGHKGRRHRGLTLPNHGKTDRPRAESMFSNYEDLVEKFRGTRWEKQWHAD